MISDLQHIMGVDHTIWYVGVVENRDDPLMLGRCQVRIIGVHPDDKTLVPTTDLPWAMPILPVNGSPAFAGMGHSPVGPVIGTTVFGIFADGIERQLPYMLGTIAGGVGHLDAGSSASLGDTLSGFVAGFIPTAASTGMISRGAFYAKFLLQNLNNAGFKIKDFHAAAIMGNIAGESGVQAVVEGHFGHPSGPPPINSHNVGYGFAQWTNSRLVNYLNYCSQHNKNPQSEDANMSFLIYELTGSFKGMLNALASGGTHSAAGNPNGPHNVDNIIGATSYVLGQFERPAYRCLATTTPRRINYAQLIWAGMKGTGQPVSGTGTYS